MAWTIFGQLDWLTVRVKRLCCAVDQIKKSGAGSYKVFTALVSQSGTGAAGVNLDTGTLQIGTIYYIKNDSPGMDFTNVGAPNNTPGTFFIATGTTPNSWGSDEGTGAIIEYIPAAPIATVLENTIGNIYFEYVGVGRYRLGSYEGLFNNPVVITSLNNQANYDEVLQWYVENPYSILLYTGVAGSGDSDNILVNPSTVEVRVYN